MKYKAMEGKKKRLNGAYLLSILTTTHKQASNIYGHLTAVTN